MGGVFGAMLTAVSGLRSQAYALENISGNIANSQTTGFKRVDTSFVDLIPDEPYRKEVAGSVAAFSRATNTIQGDLQTTSVSTNIALNGQGYFVVAEQTGLSNNQPVFSGEDLYTRRGDFDVDANGYLVNGAGNFLKGASLNPVTGQVAGSASNPIQVSNLPLPAKKTDNITYEANLPSYPATANADKTVPQSELLNSAAGFTVDPTTAGSNTVVANDLPLFLNETIPGGAMTVYNSLGDPVNVQLRLGKTASSLYGGTDTWNLFYLENANATGAQVAWRNVGANITFDTSGKLTSAQSVAIPALAVNGTNVGPVTINFGANGFTQYADANGQVNASSVRQDGYASGSLDTLSITSDGRVAGNYSNGQVVAWPRSRWPSSAPTTPSSASTAAPRGDAGIRPAGHRPQRFEHYRRHHRGLEY